MKSFYMKYDQKVIRVMEPCYTTDDALRIFQRNFRDKALQVNFFYTDPETERVLQINDFTQIPERAVIEVQKHRRALDLFEAIRRANEALVDQIVTMSPHFAKHCLPNEGLPIHYLCQSYASKSRARSRFNIFTRLLNLYPDSLYIPFKGSSLLALCFQSRVWELNLPIIARILFIWPEAVLLPCVTAASRTPYQLPPMALDEDSFVYGEMEYVLLEELMRTAKAQASKCEKIRNTWLLRYFPNAIANMINEYFTGLFAQVSESVNEEASLD